MTDEDPYRLGRSGTYYREQAAECDRLLAAIDPAVAATDDGRALVEHLRKHRDLWTQLAEELDTYLAVDAGGPGLF